MNKNEKITYIKDCLYTFGGFTTGDVQSESSPLYSSTGKDTNNLIEEFYSGYVRVYSYVHETLVNKFDVTYDSLSKQSIDEIFILTQQFIEQTQNKIDEE